MRAAVSLWLLASLAPLQCPSREVPTLAREESPAEALWQLAERFDGAHDTPARRATLSFLIERYPASRYAERARVALTSGDAAAP
jgi:hypothetical protein